MKESFSEVTDTALTRAPVGDKGRLFGFRSAASSPAAEEPIVSVQSLSKVYEPSPLWLRFLLRSAVNEPVRALTNVSLDLPAGTICAVVGPNGAGKSTLFRILTSLTTPSDGQALVGGIDVTEDSLAVRRMIGFVPAGDQTLYLRLSCVENLRFHGRLQGMGGHSLHRRINQVLEQVGIGHASERVGFALSAGMRARLLLARALLHRPSLLILDEPTAAVDPVGSHELLQVMQDIVQSEGVTVLLSSHRLEEIEALQDQVVILNQGKIVYHGDLGEFRRQYSHPSISLMFASAAAANHARAALSSDLGLRVSGGKDERGLIVVGADSVGSVLRSQGVLAELQSVSDQSLPLRDILREIVSGGDEWEERR